MQLPLANAKRPSSPGRADAFIADLLAEGYLLPIRHRLFVRSGLLSSLPIINGNPGNAN